MPPCANRDRKATVFSLTLRPVYSCPPVASRCCAIRISFAVPCACPSREACCLAVRSHPAQILSSLGQTTRKPAITKPLSFKRNRTWCATRLMRLSSSWRVYAVLWADGGRERLCKCMALLSACGDRATSARTLGASASPVTPRLELVCVAVRGLLCARRPVSARSLPPWPVPFAAPRPSHHSMHSTEPPWLCRLLCALRPVATAKRSLG